MMICPKQAKSKYNFQSLLSIPAPIKIPYTPKTQQDAPLPLQILYVSEDGQMQIQTQQNQQWLWINQPPQKIWPKLKTLWENNGRNIKSSQNGYSFEAVANFPESPNEAYQVTLTSADTYQQTTLISVDSITKSLAKKKEENSKVRPILTALANAWQQQENTDEAQKVTNQRPHLALIYDGNQHPLILIETRFTQAWELIHAALHKQNNIPTDLNRNLGIYYLTLTDPITQKLQSYQLKLAHAEQGIHISLQIRVFFDPF